MSSSGTGGRGQIFLFAVQNKKANVSLKRIGWADLPTAPFKRSCFPKSQGSSCIPVLAFPASVCGWRESWSRSPPEAIKGVNPAVPAIS